MTLSPFVLLCLSLLLLPNHCLCAAQTINLGACNEFAVMAGSADVCSGYPACVVSNGYLGVSPGTSITGHWHTDRSRATWHRVSSKSKACASQGLAALNQGKALAGKTLAAGDLGGKSFTKGVYKFAGALSISTATAKVYLDGQGNSNAKFVFIAGSSLTTAANTQIVLKNGAQAKNVYWVLGSAATLGAHSVIRGTILAGSAITIGTGGKIFGRAIAQTAVTCETACAITKS